MKLALILCLIPLFIQAQWQDTLQRDQFKMLGIHTMEKYESINRTEKTSTPELISMAHINPQGFITQMINYSSCAPPSLQYENTYLHDSILLETQRPGLASDGLISVMRYTYLPNGQIDLGLMYLGDKLVCTIQHLYSEDNRLEKIKQTWHPDSITYNFRGTEEKSFLYNEIKQLTEMWEVRRINGTKTKDHYQYIYDAHGNHIQTYVRTKEIKKRTLLEKRIYNQQNKLIDEERYFKHKFKTYKGKDTWTLQPCEVIKIQWTYNDQGLIDKEYKQDYHGRPVLITYTYKS